MCSKRPRDPGGLVGVYVSCIKIIDTIILHIHTNDAYTHRWDTRPQGDREHEHRRDLAHHRRHRVRGGSGVLQAKGGSQTHTHTHAHTHTHTYTHTHTQSHTHTYSHTHTHTVTTPYTVHCTLYTIHHFLCIMYYVLFSIPMHMHIPMPTCTYTPYAMYYLPYPCICTHMHTCTYPFAVSHLVVLAAGCLVTSARSRQLFKMRAHTP
jgi:hypothetical protein